MRDRRLKNIRKLITNKGLDFEMLTFTSPPMFEADLMTAALRPYQMASRRIRLIIRPAYRSTFALIALSTFRRTFRDLQTKIENAHKFKLLPLNAISERL